MTGHPHANPKTPANAADPSTSGQHVPVVAPQQALQAEAAVASASGFAEHHLGQASRALSTTNLTQKTCRLPVPMDVQRPPRPAPMTIESHCTKWR